MRIHLQDFKSLGEEYRVKLKISSATLTFLSKKKSETLTCQRKHI